MRSDTVSILVVDATDGLSFPIVKVSRDLVLLGLAVNVIEALDVVNAAHDGGVEGLGVQQVGCGIDIGKIAGVKHRNGRVEAVNSQIVSWRRIGLKFAH